MAFGAAKQRKRNNKKESGKKPGRKENPLVKVGLLIRHKTVKRPSVRKIS